MHRIRRRLLSALALFLLAAVPPCLGEESPRVYILGNFYFGMPVREVRALDQSGAALEETDPERETQRLTLLSDHFAVTLWFQGLNEDAPLAEMDFAFFTPPDTVIRRENRLEISTTAKTVNAVYAYVEQLCKKTFGRGRNAPDGPPPLPCLLFPGGRNQPALTRMRVYSLQDAGKTDVIAHFVAAESSGVNYVICRQTE